MEREPLVALNCGACPQMLRLDGRGELVHADGTEMCLAQDRVFPSLENVGQELGDRRAPDEVEVTAFPEVPVWHPLGAEEQTRVPRGFAVVLLVLLLVAVALTCVGYVGMMFVEMGVELP